MRAVVAACGAYGAGILASSLLFCTLALADDAQVDSEHCPTLTEESFEAHLDKRRKKQVPSFVMFHVSWCKACQRTYPQFVQAAEQAVEKEIPIDFAHVDCEGQKNLCKRFGVKGYPSIKLFEVKKDTDDPRAFKSQRTVEGFLNYAERMTQPAVRENATKESVQEALKEEMFSAIVAAVAAKGDAKDQKDQKKPLPAGLLAIADTWRDRHAILASNHGLAAVLPQAAEIPKDATLVVYSPPEQQWSGREPSNATAPDNSSELLAPQGPAAYAFYTGSLEDTEALAAWVERNRFPGVWRLGEGNFFEFTHASRRTAVVATSPNETQALVEAELRRCASSSLGEEYIFGAVNGVEWAESLGDFNILKQDLPRAFVTEENFEVWVEDIELLRVASLEQDLQGILDASSLVLRQSRTTWSKVQFYQRESGRKMEEVRLYASNGWKESSIVLTLLVLGTAIVGLSCRLFCACCRELLSDEYDPSSHRPPAAQQPPRQKRD